MADTPQTEATAFVDRMATRLSADPRASVGGRQRAAFIAVRPLVEAALNRGYNMKATWEALRDEKRLSMTYETFRTHCRELRPSRRATVSVDGGARATAVKPEPTPAQTRVPPSDDGAAASNQRQGFQHERVPQKDEIY